MNTPEQQAELHEGWARTIRMCAKAGVKPCYKYKDILQPLYPEFCGEFVYYEFPAAVVEGKCVFKLDVMYCGDTAFIVSGVRREASVFESLSPKPRYYLIEHCSWNPPKPKTILVEHLLSDVEYIAECLRHCGDYSSRISDDFRKALEKERFVPLEREK